jgi:hypothetical protein
MGSLLVKKCKKMVASVAAKERSHLGVFSAFFSYIVMELCWYFGEDGIGYG